jgi:hypothetical protein
MTFSFHFGHPKLEVMNMIPRRKRPVDGTVDIPLPDVGQIPNVDFAREPLEKDPYDIKLEDV